MCVCVGGVLVYLFIYFGKISVVVFKKKKKIATDIRSAVESFMGTNCVLSNVPYVLSAWRVMCKVHAY